MPSYITIVLKLFLDKITFSMTPSYLNTAKLLLFFYFTYLSYLGNAQQKPVNEKLIYAESTLAEGIRKRDSIQIAEGYYLLGKAHGSEHNYPEAYSWMYQSLRINERHKNWYSAGKVYLRLTDFELEQEHLQEAKTMLNEAVQIFLKHRVERGIIDAYYLCGQIHLMDFNPKPNYDSAMYYFKKLEVLALKDKSEKHLAEAREVIGNIYIKLHDKRALPNLEYAVMVRQKEKPESPWLRARLNLTDAYLIFKDYRKAKEILEGSQALIDKGSRFATYILVEHYETYARYFKLIGDWRSAYETKEKYELYRDEILKSDREGSVSKWRIRLETEKKDLALKLQKSQLESNKREILQQRYLLITTGIFISIFIVLVFYLYKLYQKQKLLSEHNAILIQEQNHRVKNNLQIISSLLSLQSNQLNNSEAKQAVDESQLRIEAMAVLHRQLYDTKELDKIDMEIFINNLSDIIFESYGLEEVELDHQIDLRPLEADKAVFLGLMINELISNACKHAFAGHPAPILNIDLSEKNHQITMRIKDNGLKPVSFQKKESFGMKLINMMVDQLDGHLSYEFNNGSIFTLKIT